MTRKDKSTHRTLARLRLCRMAMKRSGKYMPNTYVAAAGTDVQRTWRRAGWTPPAPTAYLLSQGENPREEMPA
jgi:hypothetical protein